MQSMPVVLTIREVPDDVKAALAREARERGQSLQAFLLGVLERQAAFGRNRELVRDLERELSGGRGADTEAPDAAELLAQARRERGGAATRRVRGSGGAA
jgi:antitoxin FitA